MVSMWIAGAIIILVKYYKQKNVNRFKMIVAYLLSGILGLIAFLVCVLFSKDLSIWFNGFTAFINYMHRKLFIHIYMRWQSSQINKKRGFSYFRQLSLII